MSVDDMVLAVDAATGNALRKRVFTRISQMASVFGQGICYYSNFRARSATGGGADQPRGALNTRAGRRLRSQG
ncbi:MAG: hypothetical protein K2V38_27780 [Gemmataceae bacterium]|nr:hypothetical protein [Gemmataceae bacterium]